jgi:pilus assembly protein CpaC
MSLTRFNSLLAGLLLASIPTANVLSAEPTSENGAQRLPKASLVYKVRTANDRIEMTVDTSRVLSLEEEIPQVQVGNKELVTVLPLSATSVQIHAKKAGVTEVNLWTKDGQSYAIDVVITGDTRALTEQLRALFPRASVTVHPTPNSVILGGFVEKPADISRMIEIAKEYYPNVIDNMYVAGSQQVLLNVMVAEVNRSGLRDGGFDFANVSSNTGSWVQTSVAGFLQSAAKTTTSGPAVVGSPQVTFGVVNQSNAFFGILALLEQKQYVKVLARPTLQTISGRPAFFQVGGELPILVPQGLGTVSVDFKKFGTLVDFVPIVLGNGRVRLEIRPQVTEIDDSIGVTFNQLTVPGFRNRVIDTGAELSFGETMVLAGLIQERTQHTKRGIPYLMDIPYVGSAFSRNKDSHNEIELLILCQPELADALPPEEVPTCLPGMASRAPGKWDFYAKGKVEVPNPDCMSGECGQECLTGTPANSGTPTYATPPSSAKRRSISSSDEPTRVARRGVKSLPSQQVSPSDYSSSRNNSYSPSLGSPSGTNPSPQNVYGGSGYDVNK